MQKKYKACNWAAVTVVTDGVGQSDPINIRIMLFMLLGLFLDWKPKKHFYLLVLELIPVQFVKVLKMLLEFLIINAIKLRFLHHSQ